MWMLGESGEVMEGKVSESAVMAFGAYLRGWSQGGPGFSLGSASNLLCDLQQVIGLLWSSVWNLRVGLGDPIIL